MIHKQLVRYLVRNPTPTLIFARVVQIRLRQKSFLLFCDQSFKVPYMDPVRNYNITLIRYSRITRI